MTQDVHALIQNFLDGAAVDVGTVTNELALQCELGCFFRAQGLRVEFEVVMNVKSLEGSTKRPKTYLDLLVRGADWSAAIELKVPLQGRHPETLYDFCADIEFVESIVAARKATTGIALLLSNDRTFWSDSGRGSEIHNMFRAAGSKLSGIIQKPTGDRNSCVMLRKSYDAAGNWISLRDARLMKDAKYLLLQVSEVALS